MNIEGETGSNYLADSSGFLWVAVVLQGLVEPRGSKLDQISSAQCITTEVKLHTASKTNMQLCNSNGTPKNSHLKLGRILLTQTR